MNTAEIIKKCRWEKGWSQRQLSEVSGIARQTISDAESNRRGTSVAILVGLLDAMGYELVVTPKGNQTRFREVEAIVRK